MKLSQVIDPGVAGADRALRDYATRATFDFVICDVKTAIPEFAIELDDLSHRSPDATERDRKKNRLCLLAGFELLRVEANALETRFRRLRLIEYLLDARALGQAFDEAQTAGSIPWDEPFDPRMVIAPHPEGGLDFPNDLAAPARRAALLMHGQGAIAEPWIRGIRFYWKSGVAEGWAWLRAQDDLFFFERTTLRDWHFYCGLSAGEVAEDIAASLIGDRLQNLISDPDVLVRPGQIQAIVDRLLTRRDELEDASILDHARFA